MARLRRPFNPLKDGAVSVVNAHTAALQDATTTGGGAVYYAP